MVKCGSDRHGVFEIISFQRKGAERKVQLSLRSAGKKKGGVKTYRTHTQRENFFEEYNKRATNKAFFNAFGSVLLFLFLFFGVFFWHIDTKLNV